MPPPGDGLAAGFGGRRATAGATGTLPPLVGATPAVYSSQGGSLHPPAYQSQEATPILPSNGNTASAEQVHPSLQILP